jgi:hypothetical protein
MERYRNSSGASGVNSFEIGNDFIRVKFTGTSKTYSYSYRKAGSSHVENMKSLARRGSGLNAYINQYTKHLND